MDKQRKVLRLVEVKTTKEGLKEALSGYRKLTCIVEAAPLAEWTATSVEAPGPLVHGTIPSAATPTTSSAQRTALKKQGG